MKTFIVVAGALLGSATAYLNKCFQDKELSDRCKVVFRHCTIVDFSDNLLGITEDNKLKFFEKGKKNIRKWSLVNGHLMDNKDASMAVGVLHADGRKWAHY